MKYDNGIGMNSRLDSIQAGSILMPKLAAFAEYEVADANRAAAKYTELMIVATLLSQKD